jgi:glycerol-3-phosphate dehydrogenase
VTSSSLLSQARREADLAAVRRDPVDVLVVGGGVTGAGVALDAATRGLSVALIEKNDLAAGTSRWSSKLAHGGLRYIVAGQIGVAWESAVERNLLFRTIAPHLVQPMQFVIPDLPGYPPGNKALARTGFTIADVLRVAARSPKSLPRTRWISSSEARRLVPALQSNVRGAFLTVDGALEDDARLVVALARTAAANGARVITRCVAVDVHRDGARVRDSWSGEEFDVRARAVVVAAGVWCGQLVQGVPLQPSKGAHVLVRAEALGNPTSAFNILVPGSRNRFVFAVPRPDGTVQVGLTDEPVAEVVDEPEVSTEDEQFLLSTLSTGLGRAVTTADVVGRFAGLRPLLGQATGDSAADLSRRHALINRDGVHTIVGGKLTTYRRMAQDTVDAVAAQLGVTAECRTAALALVGSGAQEDRPHPRLVRRFGSEAAQVAACGPIEPIAPGVPMLKCEVGWACSAEGALDAADVERRLRLDLVPDWRELARPYIDEGCASAAR